MQAVLRSYIHVHLPVHTIAKCPETLSTVHDRLSTVHDIPPGTCIQYTGAYLC